MSIYLFVINPISGGIDKSQFKKELKEQSQLKEFSYQIYETCGNRSEDIEKIGLVCKKEKIRTVIACGGDGTINLVAESVIEDEITLGIIPLGSANGLAKEFDLPQSIEKFISIIQAESTMDIDVLWIEKQFLSLHLSDIGFNAQMIQKFDTSKKRGYLNYGWQVLKELFKKDLFKTKIEFNGRVLKRKLEMLIFANAKKFGNGAIFNPDGIINDGIFEVILFDAYPRKNLLILTYLFFSGRLKQSNYIQFYQTKEVFIKNKKPQVLQVDGDIKGSFKKITIQQYPRKLRIIVNG